VRDVITHDFGLSEGDFLVNLFVDISSRSLVLLCHTIRVPSPDICVEP
jgi:hypothetical protein